MPSNRMFRGAMLAATMLAAATFVFVQFSLSWNGTSAVADGQFPSKMLSWNGTSAVADGQFPSKMAHSFTTSNSTNKRSALVQSLRNHHTALQENADTIAINQRIDGIHIPHTGVQLSDISKTAIMVTNTELERSEVRGFS
jgi:hypothetical protein